MIYRSNHEEADSRLVYQAYLEKGDVVIACKDTDVLILMVWAHTFYDVNVKWYLKYDREKYADISKICDFFGREICLSLPAFHAVTGCDTTSYFYRAGKVRVLKKLLGNPAKCTLLSPLGRNKVLSDQDIESVKTFIQTVVYSGKDDEDYVSTRIRLYENLKSKSSMPIPPDPDSVVQVIKRGHHQVYEWIRCCTPWVDTISLEENGWLVSKDLKSKIVVKPVWYTGSQLPPSASKNRRKKRSLIVTSGDIADDDLTEAETTEVTFQKQRKQKTFSKKKFKGNSIMSSISTNVENQTRTNAKLNIDNNIPPLPDIIVMRTKRVKDNTSQLLIHQWMMIGKIGKIGKSAISYPLIMTLLMNGCHNCICLLLFNVKI